MQNIKMGEAKAVGEKIEQMQIQDGGNEEIFDQTVVPEGGDLGKTQRGS